jgi:hypothetical protein
MTAKRAGVHVSPKRLLSSVTVVTVMVCPGMVVQGAVADPPAAPQAQVATMTLPDIRERFLTTRIVRSKQGLDYTIFISAPDGAPPAGGFPVLYVLDANAWFGLAGEIARLNEIEFGPSIVVGVGYPVHTLYDELRRDHDFTLGPPVRPQPASAGAKFGGAAEFLDFLRHELRDAIGKTYPINPRRQALFGHSLGGYFVLHALFTAPDAFATFVAASSAIWWDDAALKAEEKAFIANTRSGPQPQVLVTVGGLEQELGAADRALITTMYARNPAAFGGATLEQTLDRIRDSQVTKNRMIDNAREMAARLKAAGMPVKFVVFEGENHRTEVPEALTRAVPLWLREQP